MTSVRSFIESEQLEQVSDELPKQLKVYAEAWVDTTAYKLR